MSRNVFLNFDEWELINNELSDQEYHHFWIHDRFLEDWKYSIKRYHKNGYTHGEPTYKFERVGIYPEVNQVKSPKAVNILCREDWRPQDMICLMKSTFCFIGYILNHCDGVNMDTSLDEWDDIRSKMHAVIKNSGQDVWFSNQLIELYNGVVVDKCSAENT